MTAVQDPLAVAAYREMKAEWSNAVMAYLEIVAEGAEDISAWMERGSSDVSDPFTPEMLDGANEKWGSATADLRAAVDRFTSRCHT